MCSLPWSYTRYRGRAKRNLLSRGPEPAAMRDNTGHAGACCPSFTGSRSFAARTAASAHLRGPVQGHDRRMPRTRGRVRGGSPARQGFCASDAALRSSKCSSATMTAGWISHRGPEALRDRRDRYGAEHPCAPRSLLSDTEFKEPPRGDRRTGLGITGAQRQRERAAPSTDAPELSFRLAAISDDTRLSSATAVTGERSRTDGKGGGAPGVAGLPPWDREIMRRSCDQTGTGATSQSLARNRDRT